MYIGCFFLFFCKRKKDDLFVTLVRVPMILQMEEWSARSQRLRKERKKKKKRFFNMAKGGGGKKDEADVKE